MHAPVHWLALCVVLLTTLALGISVHELLHLVPLHFVNASYTVTLLPTDEDATPTGWTTLQSALTTSLVRVEVTHVPPTTPVWVVRVAALLPLVLALPLLLVAAGVLPNPLASGDHAAALALITLTGCGLPSPADWTAVWHGSDLCRAR